MPFARTRVRSHCAVVAEPDLSDLLEGLEGEARAARERLVRALLDDGCTPEEIRAAAAEDRLALLPVDRVLASEGRLTLSELAEASGVDEDVLERTRAAFGLGMPAPGERRFGEEDLEMARALKTVLDAGMPLESIVEFDRVVGRAMLQVAAASRGLVTDALVRPGVTEGDFGLAAAAAAREMVPALKPVLGTIFEAHLRELLRSDVISAAALSEGRTPGTRTVTVAFADLVGFTRLGEQVPAEELGEVAGRFEELAASLVARPVTLVKSIGDAVMLVSPDADPLLDVALALVEQDLPHQLRVGLAHGPALERAGDWYGSPVNQASRVTAIARPGSVLATAAVREHAAGEWRWSYARERRLKGIGDVRLFRARRPDA